MNKYYVFSSEKVYYRTIVEADSPDDAMQKFLNMDHNAETLEVMESDHWQIDDVVDYMENENA